MNAVTGEFVRRAHHVIQIKIKTRPIAIAVDRDIEVFAHHRRNLAIPVASQRHVVEFFHLGRGVQRGNQFAGIELIGRIKELLDAPQILVEFGAKKFGHILAAQAFAVFTPHHPAVFQYQIFHRIGDQANQFFIVLMPQIQGRPHVQTADIDVPEHAVLEPVLIEHLAKLLDIGRQMLGRYHRVLNKRNRTAIALGIAQQPHPFRAQLPKRGNVDIARRHLIPHRFMRLSHERIELGAKRLGLRFHHAGVVAGKFNQVDRFDVFITRLRKEFADPVPHHILPGQRHDGVVHGLNRSRIGLHQDIGRPQTVVEAQIFGDDQPLDRRQRGQLDFDLGDKRQRALRARDDRIEIKSAVLAVDMGQIVAGQKSRQFRKALLDEVFFRCDNVVNTAMDAMDGVIARLRLPQRLRVERHTVPGRAIGEYDI